MIALRKFKESDWDGFSGCEAVTPLIGGVTFLHEGRKIEGDIIADKDDVMIFIEDYDNENNDRTFIFTLHVPQRLGKFIVENMANTFDADYLDGLAFVSEGNA